MRIACWTVNSQPSLIQSGSLLRKKNFGSEETPSLFKGGLGRVHIKSLSTAIWRNIVEPKFAKMQSKLFYLRLSILSLFLLLPYLLLAQSLLTQRLNFETQETPIADALIELSEVADINIAFSPRLFSKDQTVELSLQDKKLEDILKACLAGTGITFKLEGGHLILFKQPKKQYTLSGYIEDAKTGERLVAATIYETYSGRGATTNDYGFYSLKLPEGKIELQSSYLGYQGATQSLTHQRAQKLTLTLSPSITLQEIIVTDKDFEAQQNHIDLGKGTSLPLQKMKTQIALGGEADVLRYMNTLSGVQSGADGFGGIHVRGGNSDQNLVLMDGVPIYNPSHTLGLFSIFNTQIVKSAQLVKGGFSAKYGGRLSSIMDIRMKEGNTKEYSAAVEIGTLASKLLIEGPIKKDKTGLLIAARRTHVDPLINGISSRAKSDNEEEGAINYHFFDFNAKLHHRFSNQDQLYLSYYIGKDDFRDASVYVFEDDQSFFYQEDREQQVLWGNRITALRWNHLFNDRLFSNTTFTHSRYHYGSENLDWLFIEEVDFITDDYLYTTFQSNINDIGIKVDFEFYPSPKHQLLFGGSFMNRTFESGTLEYLFDNRTSEDPDLASTEDFIDDLYELPQFNAQEIDLYVEDKISFSDRLSLMTGLQLLAFKATDKTYFLPQPRFHLLWNITPTWHTSIAGSRMVQPLHILSTSGGGLPNDLWVPSTATVRPQEAWQIEWTTQYATQAGWSLSSDIFYKKLNHLIAYGEESSLPSLEEFDPDFWEDEITYGQGEAYGGSMTLEKNSGKLTGQVNYSFTISNRQFEDINNNEPYPFRFNHRHEWKSTVQYQLNKTTAFHVQWHYGSGQPISLIKTDSRFAPLHNFTDTETELIGTVNSYRLPTYHRLDMGFHFHWQRPSVVHHLTLGVYNLYNRKNPFYVYLYEDTIFPEDSGLQQQNGLPLLPSISYRVVF